MSVGNSQDVDGELGYQARQAALVGTVRPTNAETLLQYREHRHWRIFHKEFFFHAITQAAPRRICNIGCGAGETSVELAALGYEVMSFDISPEQIALAKRRAELDGVSDRCEFVVADISHGGRDATFDLVLCEAVLHHLDLGAALLSVERMLKPGGVAIFQEPVAFSPRLQKLRDATPVSKDLSPNERQLTKADVELIEQRFEVLEKRFFHLFTRLLRLPGEESWLGRWLATPLRWLDYFLMSAIPPLRHFAGVVVIVARKREAST